MSNREQALRELVGKWLDESWTYPDHAEGNAAKAAVRLCAKELKAALALPADAAEPWVPEHSAFEEVHFLVMHREKEYRDAGNHKRANEIAHIWNDWISALEARRAAPPSAVLTEEQITTIIKIFYNGFTPPDPIRLDNLRKALRLLSAPAQRRDRIDNVTRDTPGEGKL